MAQIINTPSRSAYAGQQAGSALGRSLEGLAQNFVGEFTRGKQRSMFEQQYPEHADILSQFHANPEVQQKLIANIEKNRFIKLQQQAAEQKALQEAQNDSIEGLYAQGYPLQVAEEIAGQRDPKIRDFLKKNYLKLQAEPQSALGNILGGIGNQLGFKSNKVPRLFEEQKQGRSIQQQVGFNPQQAQQETAPIGTLTSSLENLALKPGLALTGLLEGIGSLPGALAELPSALVNIIPNLLGKGDILTPASEIPEAQKQISEALIDRLGLPENETVALKRLNSLTSTPKLPSAKDIRKGVIEPIANKTGLEKTFLPQNGQEEAFTRVFQEAAPEVAQALASGGILPIAKGVAKGVARSLGANAAGWLAQDITGSEKAGTAFKIGTYIASSFVPGMLNRTVNEKYNNWKETVSGAKDKKVSIKPIDAKLQKIQEKVKHLDARGNKAKFINDRLASLEDKFNYDGKGNQFIDADALSDLRFDQNKMYRDAVKAGAKEEFNDLLTAEKDLLKHWADKTGNSKAYKDFIDANEMYAGIKKAGDLKTFIANIPGLRSGIFGASLLLGPIGWAGKTAAVGAYGLARAGQHMFELLSVPGIRAEFTKALKASAAGNTKAAAIAINNLDKKARKVNPELADIFSSK